VSRDIEHELVPMAQEYDLSVFPWSPLAGGFLTGKFTKEKSDKGSRRDSFDFPLINKEKAYDLVDVMKEIAAQHNATVAQIALAWVRHQQGVTSTIIGAKTIEQLNDNLQSVHIQLSPEDLKKIDEISPLELQYPGWMMKRQSEYRI
jgi:aryl-alcohol dehydrogenase-like predicted oxidoreductase